MLGNLHFSDRLSENQSIAGRLVDPDGTVGSEFRISTGNGAGSDVAFDGSQFFVIWRESLVDAEIRGRFVSPAGMLGKEISVNDSPAPSDNPKSITFNGTHYLVVWNDEVGGPGIQEWNAFGQLVSTRGDLVGEPITITGEAGPQLVTSAASDGVYYLVLWMDMQVETNADVFAQFVSPGGSLIGSKIPISTESGNQIGGVVFACGKYLAIVNHGVDLGENGLLAAESAAGTFILPPASPQVQSSDASFGVRTNQFGFNIIGSRGLVTVVEVSTNLTNPIWTPVKTNTLTGAPRYFADPGWNNYSRRFYRLRSP